MLLDILATIQENCLSVSPIVEIQMPRALPHPAAFGLIVIGDEILNGCRRDRHFEGIGGMLRARGFAVAWLRILPDDHAFLVAELERTMAAGVPAFCCGGIGAT